MNELCRFHFSGRESQRFWRQEREHSIGVPVWVRKLEIGFLWVSKLPLGHSEPLESRGLASSSLARRKEWRHMYVCVYVCLVSAGICVSLCVYACLYMYEFMSMCLCCVCENVKCGCVCILRVSVCMYVCLGVCVSSSMQVNGCMMCVMSQGSLTAEDIFRLLKSLTGSRMWYVVGLR